MFKNTHHAQDVDEETIAASQVTKPKWFLLSIPDKNEVSSNPKVFMDEFRRVCRLSSPLVKHTTETKKNYIIMS